MYIKKAVLRCVLSVVAAGLLAGGMAQAAGPYAENWDAGDTNGWIPSTTSSVVVRDGTEGNPPASLAVRRDLAPPVFDTGATTLLPALTGDYTGAPEWMFSFDAKYDTGSFTDTWLRFRYKDPTYDGWHLDVADAFPNSWQGHSATFDPSWTDAEAMAAGWVDETAGAVSWQLLMSDVYHPEVRFILGDDQSAIAHIDNVALKVVPEPAAATLALVGLLACGYRRRR